MEKYIISVQYKDEKILKQEFKKEKSVKLDFDAESNMDGLTVVDIPTTVESFAAVCSILSFIYSVYTNAINENIVVKRVDGTTVNKSINLSNLKDYLLMLFRKK